MATIPDVQRAAFGTTEFHRFVVDVSHEFGPGFIAHRIPHRSGAKQEETGNPPVRIRYQLEFAGATWRADAGRILGAMIDKPRGVLVDPVWGKLRMVLKPITGTFQPAAKGTWYGCALTFEEDTLDQRIQFSKGPAALSQDMNDQCTSADTGAQSWTDSLFAHFSTGFQVERVRTHALQAQASVSTFTAAARDYSALALEQFSTGVWNPQLDTKLRVLPSLAAVAEVQMRALAERNVFTYDTVSSMELATKTAVDLDFAIRANVPPPIIWTVQQKIALLAFVGLLYPGKSRDDKFAMADHITRINRILRADVLDAGLRLVVPAP